MTQDPSRRARKRRRFVLAGVSVFAVLALTLLVCAEGRVKAPAGSTNGKWNEIGREPVIIMGRQVQPYILWNDPSVLRDRDGFRMWLSGGDARNLKRIVVQVYEAFSRDGEHWDIHPEPVMSPSEHGWDSLRTETPSVIKVGDTYHMYYTGFDEAASKSGVTQIGHATSPDGTNWTKDPQNPILSGQDNDKHKWAYGGVGEPGIVFNPANRTFFLYYAGMKVSEDGKNHGLMGILLATSKDGTHFERVMDKDGGDQQLILFRDVRNATKNAWFGDGIDKLDPPLEVIRRYR